MYVLHFNFILHNKFLFEFQSNQISFLISCCSSVQQHPSVTGEWWGPCLCCCYATLWLSWVVSSGDLWVHGARSWSGAVRNWLETHNNVITPDQHCMTPPHTTHHRQQIIVHFRASAGNMKMKILCFYILAFIVKKKIYFFQNHRNLEMSVVTQAGSGHHKYKVSSLIFSFSVDSQPWTDW